MKVDEGYIKYNCRWEKAEAPPEEKVSPLNYYRQELFKMNLVGAYPKSGIGFGNVSVRDGDSFIISGTATGKIEELDAHHYTRVTDYNFKTNTVYCVGPVRASSEALTHAMIYEEAGPKCKAVLHIHDEKLWKRLLYLIPTTGMTVSYGTPEMALEVKRLYRESDLSEKKIMAMAGHFEGIIAFGDRIENAFNILLDIIAKQRIE